MFHKHIWRELEKNNKSINYGNGIYSCRVCKKIKGFKKSPKNVLAQSIWCSTCGRDLWEGKSRCKKIDNETYKYICERCGDATYVRFDIAPVGIKTDEFGIPLRDANNQP